jgi:hypothetical protein
MSSALGAQHWKTSHPNVLTIKMIKQSSLEDKESKRRCFDYKKGHSIADCPKEDASKQVCQTGVSGFGRKFQNFWTVQQRLQSGT